MTDSTSRHSKPEQAAELGPYRFTVRATDADYHDRLHLSSLFSFMQEAAYLNAEALQIGTSRLDSQGMCWILIRISVRLRHLPHWGETVTVDTWSRGHQKLVFLRDFDFYDQQGQKFGSATSEWLIASKDSHRPQRPGQFLPPDFHLAGARAVFDQAFARPAPLSGAAANEPVLTKYADYSDIDRVKHVNNTRYIAWCVDAVHALQRSLAAGSLELPDLLFRGLDIHYVSEVRLGAKVHCYCQAVEPADQGLFLVEARRADDGSPVFRARVLAVLNAGENSEQL